MAERDIRSPDAGLQRRQRAMAQARPLVRRVAQFLITLWIVATIVFIIFRLVPGDPATMTLGLEATDEQREIIRERMGLHEPLIVQYGTFMGDLLRGDLGIAYSRGGTPVADIVLPALGRTLLLITYAIVLATVISIVAGVHAASSQGRWFDHLSRGYALAAFAVPGFWLAIVFIMIFSVRLGWFPTGGYVSMRDSIVDHVRHAILPTITVAILVSGIFIRFVRASMVQALREMYIRTARAKGAGKLRTLYKHALRNALIPFVTVAGLQYGMMIGGLVITEFVFSWSGLGLVTITAVNGRQFDIAQVAVLLAAAGLVISNMLVDLLYTWVDPRIDYSQLER